VTATLLVVHHSPTASMRGLTEAAVSGTRDEAIEGVEVVVRAALEATAEDVLGADGYLLGTPANFGYMSGALKHFFDVVYYPCLEATQGRPYGLYVHGNEGVEGALRSVEAATTGLRWRRACEVVTVLGEPDRADLQRCWELGATMAAGLM
jgi:multimeric flavodoxin WrbA